MKKNFAKKIAFRRLTKREFIFLAALFFVFEGYLLYEYLLFPKWLKHNDAASVYQNSLVVINEAEKEYARKDLIENQLKQLLYKKDKLSLEIPSYLSEEESMLSLGKLSKEQGLVIHNIAFDSVAQQNYADFVKQAKVGQPDTGNTAASEAKAEQALASQPVVLVQKINLSFEGSYKSFYGFLKQLELSSRKVFLNSFTYERKPGDGIRGNAALSYVAYKEKDDVDKPEIVLPEIKGKDNPFIPYEGYVEAGQQAYGQPSSRTGEREYKPNFFLVLNTYDDNAPKAIIGEYKRVETEVYADGNEEMKGKFSISGSKDEFTYTFTLQSVTRTEKKKLAFADGVIRLDVLTNPRKSSKDMVGIVFDVENKTQLPLELRVINDDKAFPRFKLGEKTGNVSIK